VIIYFIYENCIMSNRGVAYRVFDRKPSGKRRVGTPRRELQDNIKTNIQE
jgi:hypothetical protein